MPSHRARFAACALAASAAVCSVVVASGVPAASAALTSRGGGHRAALSAAASSLPALTLDSQTPWVTPTAPWFNVTFGVGASAVPVADLHVDLTFYGRIYDASQLEQDMTNAPGRDGLLHVSVPVSVTAQGRVAAACVTVLRDARETPPPPTGTGGSCGPSAPDLVLGCAPNTGVCGDVYPISAALVRAGAGTGAQSTSARFTTFLAYEEPGGPSGPPLRVSLVVPLGTGPGWSPPATPAAIDRMRVEHLVDELVAAHGVTVTLAINPRMAEDLFSVGGHAGRAALASLTTLAAAPAGDEVLAQPYVPVDLASLSAAGLDGEIRAQMQRGTDLLHAAGLHPASSTWVDTSSDFTTGNAADLAGGLGAAGASQLVLADSDLVQAGSDELTFAQPFSLALSKGARVMAAGANSAADARFTADPADPVLAAQQLLAMLEFFHFENASLPDARGVVLTPPAGWNPAPSFVTALFGGLDANPALTTVTVDTLFSQVPQGGNDEPSSRELRDNPSPASETLSRSTITRLTSERRDLGSFTAAVSGHPTSLTSLGDELLSTEASTLSPSQRNAALADYDAHFDAVTSQVTLAAERTITFTSRTAPIPVTVLSSAPYTVTVIMSLVSDKFAFPDGNTRTLTLNRPTTPVRVQAEARTSGDRLPVTVTLRTPDGLLVIAHAQVTVRSTSISVVGIALTVLAGLTLLVWWGRTWRRERKQRLRAH